MGGLSTPYLDLQIKIYKLFVYSSRGPSQEESSKHLRQFKSMLLLTPWMSVLWLNNCFASQNTEINTRIMGEKAVAC